MQEFKERCDAEIRNGERPQDEEATIEEWLQNVMLVTDMDKDDPEDRNKVTLMTVHSAKGLEYKYVYIVGLEENLFPSQRAAESPDGMEEERRLFYVAPTRAKVEATISTPRCVSRGNMEFSRLSFPREIDLKYVRPTSRYRYRHRRRPPAPPLARRIRTFRLSTNCAAASTTVSSRNSRLRAGTIPGSGGGRPGSNSGCGNFGGRPPTANPAPQVFARAAAPRDARLPQGRPDLALVRAPPLDRRHAPHRCGRRPTAAYPSAIRCPSAAIIPWTARRAPGVGIVQRIETPRHRPQAGRGLRRRGRKDPCWPPAKPTKL